MQRDCIIVHIVNAHSLAADAWSTAGGPRGRTGIRLDHRSVTGAAVVEFDVHNFEVGREKPISLGTLRRLLLESSMVELPGWIKTLPSGVMMAADDLSSHLLGRFDALTDARAAPGMRPENQHGAIRCHALIWVAICP